MSRTMLSAAGKWEFPPVTSNARAAATDILAVARKGRSFAAIGSLHQRHNGLVILEGTLLAVTASLMAGAKRENLSARDIGIRAVV